ncbi:MAG: hypothetical protein QM529_02500 [Hydrotalea sp.]|nr:hypothetical protein [Hydrotalea sp.]
MGDKINDYRLDSSLFLLEPHEYDYDLYLQKAVKEKDGSITLITEEGLDFAFDPEREVCVRVDRSDGYVARLNKLADLNSDH